MKLFDINKKILEWCQRRNNKLYENNGLTDKVLENQIRINKIRTKKNVHDNENVLTDEGYVQ